jgi:hypothetical protein
MIVLVSLVTPLQDAQDCSSACAVSKEKAIFEIFKSNKLFSSYLIFKSNFMDTKIMD